MENVVIVGNCQARPLASIISAFSGVRGGNVFLPYENQLPKVADLKQLRFTPQYP